MVLYNTLYTGEGAPISRREASLVRVQGPPRAFEVRGQGQPGEVGGHADPSPTTEGV
jgi:hypothetical protein